MTKKTRIRNSTKIYHGKTCDACGSTQRQQHDNRCVTCLKNRQTNYNIKLREKNFMQKHGVSYAERAIMFENQSGQCLICTEPGSIDLVKKGASTKGRLFVDHCHTTGKIRGLICNSCNIGLGVFKDNPDILMKAAEYLRS